MGDITIFTDGSSRFNPGPGGWGVVVMQDDKVIDAMAGTKEETTNNEMEMTAIVQVLQKYGDSSPIVYTDSAYAYNTFTKWMYGWQKNGWMRPKSQPVANLELVQQYYNLELSGKKVELRWVRGHNGNAGNELADKLATGKISVDEAFFFEK